MNKFNALIYAALVTALIAGCTASTAYQTMQATAKQACQKQAPTEREQCESRINKEDYDTYENKRSQN